MHVYSAKIMLKWRKIKLFGVNEERKNSVYSAKIMLKWRKIKLFGVNEERKNSVVQHEIFNIISRDRKILRKITQNFGSGSVLFTKLNDLTTTTKFTCPLMICTPVSKASKSANDNSRMKVAA